MTQPAPQIVHESEAQRQFVRVHMPAKALLNGKTYILRDLSSGGLAIQEIEGPYEKSQVLSLELMLPFNDFTLDVQIEAQIQNIDTAGKIIGVRFINLSKQQISLLNHVIKSFIAGDVVEGGDVLNVVARDNFVRVRKQDGALADNDAPKLSRQIIPLLVIVLLGALGALVIANSVYQSAFIIKSTDGVVEGELLNVTAPTAGNYKSALAAGNVSVKTGEMLGTLTNAMGLETAIISPCDCYIFETTVKDGQAVTADQALMKLTPTTSNPIIKVRMDSVTVQRLKMASIPTITIAGDEFERTGRIVDVKANVAVDEAAATLSGLQPPFAYITIQSDQKIPSALIGRPAQAMFKTY